MAQVYSYVRFSDPSQSSGDSVERQVRAGAAWMKRNPQHTLDTTLSLKDLGIPAFRGHNLDPLKGDLGKFLALVKQQDSPIAKGSILMIEALDRFSRLPPTKVSPIFYTLIEAGIDVLTLNPEQLITADNINDPAVLLPINLYMSIAHEQSKEKRRRVGAAWKRKRDNARKGIPITPCCPAWLRYDKKADTFVVKPEGKKAVIHIFKRTIQGCGQLPLTRELNKRFKPIARKAWSSTYIRAILDNRAVIGEYQPYTTDELGNGIPDGAVIKGYYPRIIPDDLFYRAKAAIGIGKQHKGRNADWVHLFAGLIYYADGSPAHINTHRKPKYTLRTYVSFGRLRGLNGANPTPFKHSIVEDLVLKAITEITPDDVRTRRAGGGNISRKVAELAGVEAQLEELQSALGNRKKAKQLPQVIGAIEDLNGRKEKLAALIDKMNQDDHVAASKPLEEVKSILESKGDNRDLRLRLRALIALIVERITIDPVKETSRRNGATIVVAFKSGDKVMIEYREGRATYHAENERLGKMIARHRAKVDNELKRKYGVRLAWDEPPMDDED